MSLQLGESCDSLDKLASEDYIGMKLGEKAANLEVVLIPNPKDPNKSVLRITKKGHLAKLLDARNQLKELLIKVDGKSNVQKVLDEMMTDPSLMREIVEDKGA